MEKAAKYKLKQFLEDNIPFYELKKAGFFKCVPGIRKTDYEKIAARVCWFFGYKTIYEYAHALDTACGHLSMGNADDKFGMEPGYGITIKPKVDMGCPLYWNKLNPPDQESLVSQDKFLN